MFVDQVTIEVQAGKGGDGCCSFLRLRYVPRGGPNGGNGGRGGSIVIAAEEGVNNLSGLARRKLWQADRGTHGQGSDRHGKNADDLVIHVPPGTTVTDLSEGLLIRDLTKTGDQFVVARGGKGGKGNACFKSARNQAPREFTLGEEGQHRRLLLELKSIADVGLIGMPNAGKSTLLSRLTKARPEIANYPFTTKHPNLGLVELDYERSFVLADIPGLIEGAHTGMGLGHDFLKHIQRSGVLVHLVEPMPMDGSDPVHNYRAIRNELAQFDAELANRPEIVVVSKCELPEADEVARLLTRECEADPLRISAATGHGLDQLVKCVWEDLQQHRSQLSARS